VGLDEIEGHRYSLIA
jgi:hypothetical protein